MTSSSVSRGETIYSCIMMNKYHKYNNLSYCLFLLHIQMSQIFRGQPRTRRAPGKNIFIILIIDFHELICWEGLISRYFAKFCFNTAISNISRLPLAFFFFSTYLYSTYSLSLFYRFSVMSIQSLYNVASPEKRL